MNWKESVVTAAWRERKESQVVGFMILVLEGHKVNQDLQETQASQWVQRVTLVCT